MCIFAIAYLVSEVAIEIMNLVEFGRAHADEFESSVPFKCSLDLNGCIYFPLNPDPKLLITLINLLLQSRILLLQLPVLKAHGLHSILLINIRLKFICKHSFVNFALKKGTNGRLQAYCCIVLYGQLLVLDKNWESRMHFNHATILSFLEVAGPTFSHVRRNNEVCQLGIEFLQHIISALPAIIELLLKISFVVLFYDGFFVACVLIFVCKYLRRMAIDILNWLS